MMAHPALSNTLILHKIFQQLDNAIDLAKCSSICKLWYDCVSPLLLEAKDLIPKVKQCLKEIDNYCENHATLSASEKFTELISLLKYATRPSLIFNSIELHKGVQQWFELNKSHGLLNDWGWSLKEFKTTVRFGKESNVELSSLYQVVTIWCPNIVKISLDFESQYHDDNERPEFVKLKFPVGLVLPVEECVVRFGNPVHLLAQYFLVSIFKASPNLKKLWWYSYSTLSEIFYVSKAFHRTFFKLEFFHLVELDNQGVFDFICTHNFPTLKTLSLPNVSSCCSSEINSIISSHFPKSVEKLSLTYWNHPSLLSTAVKHFPDLSHLSLYNCTLSTLVKDYPGSCPTLRVLILKDCIGWKEIPILMQKASLIHNVTKVFPNVNFLHLDLCDFFYDKSNFFRNVVRSPWRRKTVGFYWKKLIPLTPEEQIKKRKDRNLFTEEEVLSYIVQELRRFSKLNGLVLALGHTIEANLMGEVVAKLTKHKGLERVAVEVAIKLTWGHDRLVDKTKYANTLIDVLNQKGHFESSDLRKLWILSEKSWGTQQVVEENNPICIELQTVDKFRKSFPDVYFNE